MTHLGDHSDYKRLCTLAERRGLRVELYAGNSIGRKGAERRKLSVLRVSTSDTGRKLAATGVPKDGGVYEAARMLLGILSIEEASR